MHERVRQIKGQDIFCIWISSYFNIKFGKDYIFPIEVSWHFLQNAISYVRNAQFLDTFLWGYLASLSKRHKSLFYLPAYGIFFFWYMLQNLYLRPAKTCLGIVLYLNNRSLVPVGRRLGSKQVIINIFKKWSSLSPWSPGFQWLKDFKLCLLIQQIFHLFIIMGCW